MLPEKGRLAPLQTQLVVFLCADNPKTMESVCNGTFTFLFRSRIFRMVFVGYYWLLKAIFYYSRSKVLETNNIYSHSKPVHHWLSSDRDAQGINALNEKTQRKKRNQRKWETRKTAVCCFVPDRHLCARPVLIHYQHKRLLQKIAPTRSTFTIVNGQGPINASGKDFKNSF